MSRKTTPLWWGGKILQKKFTKVEVCINRDSLAPPLFFRGIPLKIDGGVSLPMAGIGYRR
jgi:hypothetical protein